MWCVTCNNDIADCVCPDISERLAKAFSSPNLAARWCLKCDQHYARCKCETPEWGIKTGER